MLYRYSVVQVSVVVRPTHLLSRIEVSSNGGGGHTDTLTMTCGGLPGIGMLPFMERITRILIKRSGEKRKVEYIFQLGWWIGRKPSWRPRMVLDKHEKDDSSCRVYLSIYLPTWHKQRCQLSQVDQASLCGRVPISCALL